MEERRFSSRFFEIPSRTILTQRNGGAGKRGSAGTPPLGAKAFLPSVVRRAIFRGRIFSARRLRVRREPSANKLPRGRGFGGVFGRETPVVAFALDARFFFCKIARTRKRGVFFAGTRCSRRPDFRNPTNEKKLHEKISSNLCFVRLAFRSFFGGSTCGNDLNKPNR